MPRLIEPALAAGSLARLEQPSFDLTERPWRAGDEAAVVAAYADPAIQRWHVRTMTEAEAREWIDSWPERWANETGAGWAIAADSGVVGQVSLRRLDLTEASAQISYWVAPSARGRGAAGRALRAVTEWSFGDRRLHRLEVHHSTTNQASCRVAVKAGYPLEGTMRSAVRHADGWHDMHMHVQVSSE